MPVTPPAKHHTHLPDPPWRSGEGGTRPSAPTEPAMLGEQVAEETPLWAAPSANAPAAPVIVPSGQCTPLTARPLLPHPKFTAPLQVSAHPLQITAHPPVIAPPPVTAHPPQPLCPRTWGKRRHHSP